MASIKNSIRNLDVSSAGAQKRRAGVPEGGLRPGFIDGADTSRNLTDLIPHERLSPIRPSAFAIWTGKAQPPGGSVLCLGGSVLCLDGSFGQFR